MGFVEIQNALISALSIVSEAQFRLSMQDGFVPTTDKLVLAKAGLTGAIRQLETDANGMQLERQRELDELRIKAELDKKAMDVQNNQETQK